MKQGARMGDNKLKHFRESRLISKTTLARKADVSPITISRIERGLSCRPVTKRKILLALGVPVSDQYKIFSD